MGGGALTAAQRKQWSRGAAETGSRRPDYQSYHHECAPMQPPTPTTRPASAQYGTRMALVGISTAERMVLTAKQSDKLLVVDDERSIQRPPELHLARAGYDVVTAVEGIQGLELTPGSCSIRDQLEVVRHASRAWPVDDLRRLLSIHLPGMWGHSHPLASRVCCLTDRLTPAMSIPKKVIERRQQN